MRITITIITAPNSMTHFYKLFSLLIFFCLLTLLTQSAFAQTTGELTGKITDEATGESLIGINVLLAGTTRGAATDIDGKFAIKGIPESTYTVVFSSVGYTTKTITGVKITHSKPVVLNVTLTQESFNVKEVVISADEVHSTESAILAQRKRASTISDGISSEQIRRTPDATSGDALKRVTGLSIVDNKFVNIRGIMDRYNTTTLDGANVTSTEVGSKSFSYDLIPATLIENISVIKTARPDLPGDFSGGLVQLNTLDFPSKRSLKVNIGQSYNKFTTEKAIMLPQGGASDWLGFDDGTRNYPGDKPDPNDIARSANNTWGPRTITAPYNGTFSLAYGDNFDFSGDNSSSDQLGFIGALSYKNSFQNDQKKIDDRYVSQYNTGAKFDNSILWGAIANLSYKFFGLNKISFKNNFNQSGDNTLERYNSNDYAADLFNQYTFSNWTQRSTYTGQLIGEHTLPAFAGTMFQWRAAVSSSRRDDPDRKEATYYRSLEDSTQPLGVAINNRSWAFLNERSFSFSGDVTIPLASSKLKFGAFNDSKKENYRIRRFDIIPDYQGGITDSMTELPLDEIYSPENFGPGKFKFHENSPPDYSYNADQDIFAGYGMVDMPFEMFSNNFRLVGGARLENANQNVTLPGIVLPGAKIKTTSKHNADILPSINFTYLFNDKINVRAAYSNSLNRPELQELAPTQWYDPVRKVTTGGNLALQRAYIRNYDLRIECFPNIGELVALSYFSKHITSAIEQTYLSSGSTLTKTWQNSPEGVNNGWELELRKSLGFLGGYANNFSVTGNYSRIYSNVDVPSVYSSDSIAYTRPMQGQSPYMINFSLLFTEPTFGTSVTVLYNTFGRRIETVGEKELNLFDNYEEAHETVDLAISQSLWKWIEAKFTVQNLTNKQRVLTRGGSVYEVDSPGLTYALSISLSR